MTQKHRCIENDTMNCIGQSQKRVSTIKTRRTNEKANFTGNRSLGCGLFQQEVGVMKKVIKWVDDISMTRFILLLYLFLTFMFMATSLILGTDEWVVLQCLVGIYIYLYRKETFDKKEADEVKE